jgi:hypothetical protein
MAFNQKQVGNTFERKIAKELSLWIWNDPHVLKREPTSGAVKTVYYGDIYPIKDTGWDHFPFYLEVKHGYEKNLPTLFNFNIIKTWWYKCVLESSQSNGQDIILLIYNPTGKRGTILATDQLLNIPYTCILNINPHLVYIYDYKKMISNYDFETVFK